MEVAEKMARKGFCVLTPVFPVLENDPITEEQLQKMKVAHFKRIELSDAILVVNINHYIGNSTNREIEYAKKLGKEIRYVLRWRQRRNRFWLSYYCRFKRWRRKE